MENSKKHPRSHRTSVDGFVSDGRVLGMPIKSYRPVKNSAEGLGNYHSKSDGFHPMRQAPREMGHTPEAAEVDALLNEPIVLDDKADKQDKKRRFAKKHPKTRKGLKRAMLAVLALLIIGGAYFGAKVYITERHLFRGGGKAPALAENIDINQLKGEGDGRINVLLLGVGGPGHEGADLTDTIMLASIDPINHKVALLSIPRDLWIMAPGGGSEKINAVYSNAKSSSRAKTLAGQENDGLNALDQTLTSVIGVPIHYHVVVDFKAFQQMINAVGGVDANVPEEESAHETFWIEGTANQYYTLNVPAGEQHFDGTKALYFARERHNDSDFVRAQRQRLLLSALKDKTFSAGTFSNPAKISSLLSSLGSNVYTDFSLNDMTKLYQIIQKVPSASISSLDLVTAPHDYLTTGNIGTASVVEPKAGLYQYADIQSFVRNALKDSFIANENAQVAVYNATDIPGLATASANVLKSYGYNVTTITNAPTTNPATTTIVDLTHGKDKYTKHYLEERFKVTAVGSIPSGVKLTPPAGTSFVIILGKDASNSSQTSVQN